MSNTTAFQFIKESSRKNNLLVYNFIFKMTKKQTISKKLLQQENSQNQENQEKSFSEPGEEGVDDEKDKITQKEPDNLLIPFQDFRKSFSVFSRKSRSQQFKTYAKFKPEVPFPIFKQAFTKASGMSFEEDETSEQTINKKLSALPQQNIFACSSIKKATIFIHVYRFDNKRCHIKVMNSSGYVYAYFVNINMIRKFPKIYKILTKLGKNNLFMIMDEMDNVLEQRYYVEKIADYARQFCYYCYFDLNSPLFKSMGDDFTEKIFHKDIKGNILTKGNRFCFYSNIFKQNNSDVSQNIQKMINIQQDIQNSSIFSFKHSEDSMDFILKSVLINYQKFKNCSDQSQMYASFKKIIDQHENKLNDTKEIKYGNPEDHYPQKMEKCKECVHCPKNKSKISRMYFDKLKSTSESSPNDSDKFQTKNHEHSSKNTSKGKFVSSNDKNSSRGNTKQEKKDEDELSVKVRKSKYRCEGCTAAAKRDVPLCLECFRDYHVEMDKRKTRNMNKSMKTALKRKQKESFKEQTHQVQNNHREIANLQFQEQDMREVQTSYRQDQSCEMCLENTYDDQSSQDNNKKIDKKHEMEKKISRNHQFLSLLKQIHSERMNFLQNFYELYSDPKTRKIAITTVQYTLLKTSLQISEANF